VCRELAVPLGTVELSVNKTAQAFLERNEAREM
jgi:hypothetical protein